MKLEAELGIRVVFGRNLFRRVRDFNSIDSDSHAAVLRSSFGNSSTGIDIEAMPALLVMPSAVLISSPRNFSGINLTVAPESGLPSKVTEQVIAVNPGFR